MTKNIAFTAMGLLLAAVTSATAGDGREGQRIRDDIRASSSYEGMRSDYSARASNWRALEDSRFENRRRVGVTNREKHGQD
jgi:hypothetical protein